MTGNAGNQSYWPKSSSDIVQKCPFAVKQYTFPVPFFTETAGKPVLIEIFFFQYRIIVIPGALHAFHYVSTGIIQAVVVHHAPLILKFSCLSAYIYKNISWAARVVVRTLVTGVVMRALFKGFPEKLVDFFFVWKQYFRIDGIEDPVPLTVLIENADVF